jgi:hypothetical protein
MGLTFMSGGGYLGHGDTKPVDVPKKIDFLEQYGAKAADVVCGGRHTVLNVPHASVHVSANRRHFSQ